MPALLLALTALMVLLPASLPDEAAELVAEFRVYYTRDRTPEERREAVLNLSDLDGPEVVEVLIEPLRDEDYLVRRAAVQVLGSMRGEASAAWLVEHVLEDRKLSRDDVLVAGTIESLGRMGHAPARPAMEQYLDARDLGLKLGAVRGLGALGDPEAAPALLPLMADKEPAVLVTVLEALARLDVGEVAAPAVQVGLAHPDKSVRLAAVIAVRDLRIKSGLAPLMQMLDHDADPRVSEDAYEVLLLLTQRKFADETAAWVNWWERAEPRFTMPDLDALAAARKKIAEEGSKYARGRKTFQGIETKSENILFVIDVSKSMEEPFGDPERLAATGRTYSSNQRLGIVKEELINTIDALPETTQFNIIAFASGAEQWKKRPAKASILNKNNAKSFVAALEPKGGGGAAFRARLGFSAAEANEGQTNTHLALMTAFDEPVGDDKARRKRDLVTSTTNPVDTIFFLTDGEPTVGETVDMVEIRQEVQRVNAVRGVQLHVIYVGAYGGKDFRLLAEENGGVFVAVGG